MRINKFVSSLLLCGLLLTGCSSNNGESTSKKEVYLDYNEVQTDDYIVKVDDVSTLETYSYNFRLSLSIKNITNQTQKYVFSNAELVRESTGAAYTINDGRDSSLTLDSEIEKSISFTSTIPTTLEENYYFSVEFMDIKYLVYLYETPDELRKDLTVTYIIDESILHVDNVKQGRALSRYYTYDDDEHQKYGGSWKYSDGSSFDVKNKIETDITLYGTIENNFTFTATSSSSMATLNKINHVPSDGKVVIPNQYQNKDITISINVIYNNSAIKEVYLPRAVKTIHSYNFTKCNNLSTIYYAGSEAEWNSIPKFSTIPSNVELVFNTSFEK